jgi:GPH family glycoside/pentoside/hexuronide:cation symporter
MGYVAYLISPWFLWFMQSDVLFDDMVEGASWLAIIIGAAVIFIGVIPAIFLKERFNKANTKERSVAATTEKPLKINNVEEFPTGIKGFLRGFVITLKFKPFLSLCGATFLVFNGFMLVSSFQIYVIIYYVFEGNQSLGAEYSGWAGTLSAASTFFVIFFVSWLSTKIGKKKAFYVATVVSIAGYGLKWICYHPDYPLLTLVPAPFMAFGLGALFTLMGSMIADVCDMDELETGERREGMFGSIYWWVVKLGMAVALAAGGFLLNVTGFDVALGGAQTTETIHMMRLFDVVIPMVASAIAIWMVYTYPITEQKAHEIREELEKRRQVA